MKKVLVTLFTIALVYMSNSMVIAQVQPARKTLLDVALTNQHLSQVEAKRVTMPPGQAAPKHTHPCVVVGYVVSGRVLFQIEGEEKRILVAGEAFYEPKDKAILHFDNDSSDEPLTFVAFYLKEGNEELIKIIK